MSWCCRTLLKPVKASLTISAWKWRPSPSTATCSQTIPASIVRLISSGVIAISFSAEVRHRAQCRAEEDDDREARRGCCVRQAEKAVAEPVDHIEERIEMRQRLPERRQRMDRVEDAGQERQRHDDEILECRQLVEFVGPD